MTLSAEATTFTGTASPGVYTVDYLNQDGAAAGSAVAARQFVATESTGDARQISTTLDDTATEAEGTLLREWAPLILAILLGVVLIEWWVAFGRPLPRGRRRAEVAS